MLAIYLLLMAEPSLAQTRKTSDVINPALLRERMVIFASDSMEGRLIGTPGYMKATAYLAHEASLLGLIPAGENGSFFQSVPAIERRVGYTEFRVGDRRLKNGSEYVGVPRKPPTREINRLIRAVYGGISGDSTTWISVSAAQGKFVVLEGHKEVSSLPSEIPRRFKGAAVVAYVLGPAITTGARDASAKRIFFLNEPTPDSLGPYLVYLTSSAASRLFDTSNLDATPSGKLGRAVHCAAFFADRTVEARNVIALLPGSEGVLKTEMVAFGAHADHLGTRPTPLDHDFLRAYNAVMRPFGVGNADRSPTRAQRRSIQVIRDSLDLLLTAKHADSIFNGADDDGSGSVALLEIARVVAARKPMRSILFVWHGGEEEGELGSRYFTSHPTVERSDIVAQINLDIIGGRGAEKYMASNGRYLAVIGSRRISSELGNLVDDTNTQLSEPFILDYRFDAHGHPGHYYCRSDHREYARYGIPVVFLNSGLHSDYHQVTDEPQYLDYPVFAAAASFAAAIGERIANLDHRLRVDHPVPSPNAPCVQ